MTGKEIVARATSYKKMVYWYGAKREKCTTTLAGVLRQQNPGVWTEDYYQKALKDCDGEKYACDCSGLVCGAYNIPDIGSYQLGSKYETWNGTPRAGMIGWKRGHVGIFSDDGWDAKIIEMRGIDYDWKKERVYKTCGFVKVIYDPSIDYGVESYKSIGWHKDNNGWWYRHKYGVGDGTFYADCCKIIDGHAYLFAPDGYIKGLDGTRVKPESSTGWIDS